LKKLKVIFRNYLKNIGELPDDELLLGTTEHRFKEVEQAEEVLISQFQLLAKALNKQIKSNSASIVILIVSSCLLFAIGLYLNFYYHHQPQVMAVFLGVAFLAILSIIKWLHQLWHERSTIGISMKMLGSISPKDAAEFILALYKKIFVTSLEKKILILAANPIDTRHLSIDKEVREIEDGLMRSMNRFQFDIRSRLAVRLRDIRRAIFDHSPQIVHFAGHGEEHGLMVESEEGLAVPISSKALSGLFELCSEHVECVILNACYSAIQADAINKYIKYVIGMPGKINDQAAIEFAVGFYDALGAGNTVEKAFKFGCNAIEQVFPNLPEDLMPVLKKGGTP